MKQLFKNTIAILDRRERQKFLKLVMSDVVISILDILFLIALLYVISFYTRPDHNGKLLDFSPVFFDTHPLLLIIIFFLLFSLKNLLGFIAFKRQYNFVYDVASRISQDNLLQYLQGSYLDHVHVDSSVYVRKISQQPIEFCHYVLNGFQQAFSQFILIIITVIAILFYDPLLFPLLLLLLLPPVFLAGMVMKKKLSSGRLHSKKTSEKTIQHLQEALLGFVESNVYEQNDFFTERYHNFQKKLNHYLAQNQFMQNMPSRLIEIFAVFGLLILILLNNFTEGVNTVPVVTIGAFMAAAYKIIPGIAKIMSAMGHVKTYSFTISGLLNPQKSLKIIQQDHSLVSIEFQNISFSYPGIKLLDSFNLKLEKGDVMGISGISGKGKTTIVNLLLGFLSQQSGSILFNGTVADLEKRKGFWNRISYIKQQPFFIHDSILKNIILQEGEYDSNKLKKVITATGIDELTGSYPEKLETLITENGKNLSGGQRQRIIFARALYKDFDCIILDEPFNELDEVSEINMLGHLQRLAGEGKIVLLITHNKAALSFCNKKVSIDEIGE